MKLVAFLQKQLGENHSGKLLRRLLEANLCRINGRVERFGSRDVRKGDIVELAPNWESLLKKEPLKFETVYEDDSLIIINKPAGWVSQDREGLFLVHRLDKETTGLLMFAKNVPTRDRLMHLFKERAVHKEYFALVDGIPNEKEGTRRSKLAKKGSYQGQTIWGSSHEGLTAITHWKVAKSGKDASLIHCMPETGRTHQIRVHLAEMGHPILVDRQYATAFRCKHFFQRPLLHSYRLRFDSIDVTSQLPNDFAEALNLI